jgi:hypothetical protein
MTKAVAILMIEYEVESLTPSDPAVAAMNRHANDVLNVVAGSAAADGVKVGNVYAFTTGADAGPSDPA